jgi:hypothetical protein
LHKQIAKGAVAGAVIIGAAGAAFVLPKGTQAADPSAAPSASSSVTTPGTAGVRPDGHRGGPHGLGADNVTAAAQALGMTEADVTAALGGGQTLAQIATSKGAAIQTLIDALVAAETTEINAAVQAGTMTQAEADRRLADLVAHETAEVNGTFVGGGHGHDGGHGGPRGLDADDLTAAAGALGMTEADLATALGGGQTVAQVATTKGVELQKVIDAIVAADTAEIGAAVKAGSLTQAEADARIANLPAHVADEVNGVHPGPGGDGHGGADQPAPSASAGTSGSNG